MIDAIIIFSTRDSSLRFARHYSRTLNVGDQTELETDVLEMIGGMAGCTSFGLSGIMPGRWSCTAVGIDDYAFAVYTREADLVFVVVGSGEDDELALFEVGRAILEMAREHCGDGKLDDEHLNEFWGKIVLGIDEILCGGFVEHLDKHTVLRQSKLKPFKV